MFEVVKVAENRFLRKLFIDTRVYRGSYTKKAKNSYFNYLG
nr:MAG TPA: hypothetical protein [Caudoviricetes sp.]